MKYLFSVGLLLCSLSFGVESQWKVIDYYTVNGQLPNKIKEILISQEIDFILKEAVANLLIGKSIAPIVGVSVMVRILHWEGETVCKPEDPRLTRKWKMVSYKAGGKHSTFTDTIIEQDPCK